MINYLSYNCQILRHSDFLDKMSLQRDRFELSELLPAVLTDPQQDENKGKNHNKSSDNQGLPVPGFRGGKKDHFMFDQVAGEYVQQAFGNKTDDRSQEI